MQAVPSIQGTGQAVQLWSGQAKHLLQLMQEIKKKISSACASFYSFLKTPLMTENHHLGFFFPLVFVVINYLNLSYIEMLWPLLLCSLCSLLVILRLLLVYGDRKRCAWYVQVAAATSWYLPFTIVFILPFDFSSALYRKCEHDCDAPMGYIGSEFTRRLWAVLYWAMYILTWLILPIMMSYVDSGAFTFKSRLRESAWSNFQFYGIGGLVGLVVVGYVTLTRGMYGADLVAFLMALANFWGLFLVITFMGFGLVSIPRKLWRRGDLGLELTKIEARAMTYKDKAYDSRLELVEIVRECQLVSGRIGETDDLRSCIDQILECYKQNSTASDDRNGSRSLAHSSAIMLSRVPADITESYLASLHNRAKHAVLREERDRWRWRRSARRAFFLQDAIDSKRNPNRQLESSLQPWSRWSMVRRSAAWWWYIILRPQVYRASAIFATVLSISILWSELTFNLASSHLSIVYYLLRMMGLTYYTIEITSIVAIAYMCLCAYSSVMKLRIFNIYSLEPHHHTNERSLLFCGAYLCRLMFPLCYNFLSMAGSGSKKSNGSTTGAEVTEFAQFMDRIDLVPILGEQSNRAIPVLIMIPALLAFFNVHGRVMEYFSIDRLAAANGTNRSGRHTTSAAAAADDDEEDAELGPIFLPHEEGRNLLLEARRAAERQQGVSDNFNIRRYSPTFSTNPNNLHSHSRQLGSSTGDLTSNNNNTPSYSPPIMAADQTDPLLSNGWYSSGGSYFERAQAAVSDNVYGSRVPYSAIHDGSTLSETGEPLPETPTTTGGGGGLFHGLPGLTSTSRGHIRHASANDLLVHTNGNVDGNGEPDDDGDSSSDSSSGGGGNNAATKPTGMAARFGRLLPGSMQSPQTSRSSSSLQNVRTRSGGSNSKPPPVLTYPNNVSSRLRPSSYRQHSGNNYHYASDDGTTGIYQGTNIHRYKRSFGNDTLQKRPFPGMPANATSPPPASFRSPPLSNHTTPLLLSPTSPGRLPNPWADAERPRPQTTPLRRHHAFSESSNSTTISGGPRDKNI